MDGVTLDEFEALTPWQKGYIMYMQEAWNPVLKDKSNPFAISTPDYEAYKAGEMQALLDVQDGEE